MNSSDAQRPIQDKRLDMDSTPASSLGNSVSSSARSQSPVNPSVVDSSAIHSATQASTQPSTQPSAANPSTVHSSSTISHAFQPQGEPHVLRSETAAQIPLIEERLLVDRHLQKVGEVVVRKEVTTRIIEVPVRRERVIVEQISPTYQQLASVDIAQSPSLNLNSPTPVATQGSTQVDQPQINSSEAFASTSAGVMQVEFATLDEAQQFLAKASQQMNSYYQKVQITLIHDVG
jgi:hypothetical protein